MNTYQQMRPIQMVDLAAQMAPLRKEIDAAIASVLDTTSFIQGPAVKSFTSQLSQYVGDAEVIPCANGTDALQIAMMALGLEPGDEVMVPVFTYVATAEVIALLRLKPIFVDVDPRTFNLDPNALQAKLTPKTKAIVPVHLFGQCVDMAPILDFAKQHGLFVIEDTAQAIGAVYTFPDGTTMQAGTMGHIGTTSFFPSKNLGGYGDGGAIFTRDLALAEQMRKIANHGQTKLYHHGLIGVNSRLDSIQAAILGVKLSHLDRYAQARQTAAKVYDEAFADLPGLHIPYRAANSTHVFHQYTLIFPAQKRDAIQQFLENAGVPCKVYYPIPLHLQDAYASPMAKAGDFPVSEALCDTVLSLPMHTELDAEQLQYIIEKVREALTF